MRAVHGSSDVRARLTRALHLPAEDAPGMGALEHGYQLERAAAATRARLKQAIRDGVLPQGPPEELQRAAVERGIATAQEFEALAAAEQASADLIQVDAFDAPRYLTRCGA